MLNGDSVGLMGLNINTFVRQSIRRLEVNILSTLIHAVFFQVIYYAFSSIQSPQAENLYGFLKDSISFSLLCSLMT